VLITLARFSAPARKAATVATPTVNLIDGDRLCDLVLEQSNWVRPVPVIDEAWFDRSISGVKAAPWRIHGASARMRGRPPRSRTALTSTCVP